MIRSFALSVLFTGISILCFSQSSRPKVRVFSKDGTQEFTLTKAVTPSSFKVLSVNTDQGPKDFKPEEIVGFTLENGVKYLALPIRNSQENAFFNILFEGEVSLGYYSSAYYLVVNGEAIALLEESSGGGGGYASGPKRKTYLGVLHYALDGCSDPVTDKVNETRLSFPSLESLLIDFHECKGLSYTIPGQTERYIDFGFSFSLGYSQLNSTLKPSTNEFQTAGLRAELLAQFELNKFFPRLMPEVGLAYTGFEDTWFLGKVLQPGEEQFYYVENYSMALIEILTVFNYKLIVQEGQSLYIGMGTKYVLPRKKTLSEVSQYEFMQPFPPNEIVTRPRDPVLLEMQSKFGYLAKLGYSRRVGKLSPFVEVQYDRVSNFGFMTFRFSDLHEYSLSSLTGKVGLRF